MSIHRNGILTNTACKFSSKDQNMLFCSNGHTNKTDMTTAAADNKNIDYSVDVFVK